MLSRKDVRPPQTQMLLEAGFLPVSIDYRLCPETTILEGPMNDVRTALHWARKTLPTMRLQRADIHPDGNRAVAIGWSTGGHLAMTLAWTAPAIGLAPPDAILAFYCPTDYEDPFWIQSNKPRGVDFDDAPQTPSYNLWDGVQASPITGYNPPSGSTRGLGGWMAPQDARSRICLHMNWKGQTLPILLHGLQKHHDLASPPSIINTDQIRRISPLAQIRRGAYATPTFILHGTKDDLIPWEQSQRTYEALCEAGVEAQIRIVDGAVHLFDLAAGNGKGKARDGQQGGEEGGRLAVREGYEFLRRHV